MEEWDAQMILELYIHDYLVKKNMHTTADIFTKEAKFDPKSVAINPPDGFLSEWWSFVYDVCSSRLAPPVDQASTSQSTVNAEPVPQNPVPPATDFSHMLPNMPPPMARPGMHDLLQTEIQSLMQNTFLPMVDFGPTSFGSNPVSDSNMRQDEIMANLVTEKVNVEDCLRLPPSNFDPMSNALNIDQFTRMLPSGSTYSHRMRKVNNRRQLPFTTGINIGDGLRSTTSEVALHAPKLTQDGAEHADTGRNTLNKLPSEGCSLHRFEFSGNIPLPNQQNQFSALSAGYQADSLHDLAVQASKDQMVSAPESSMKTVSPILLDDESSSGKSSQIGTSKMEKPTDDDVNSFFSVDETPEDMSHSFTDTLPQSSSAQNQKKQQGFPFRTVRSLHPTNNKLSCCDFSAQGQFLAAAGHEKKVFIWNMKQSNRQTIQGHSQLITDIRFMPSSNILATSSFDRTVKIWDATSLKKEVSNLVGHADQVMSVDFHPRMPNLLCSCDCSDEIRLWNVKESTCFRTFKGANKQVRFQPRQGNLLAAATGNTISLIDIETGVIQHTFKGHDKDVRSISWDEYGHFLASVSEDSTRIWSIVSGGKNIGELHSGGGDFASCTFHPAYTHVIAIGSYQSIYIWNAAMGNRTWNFPAHKGIVSGMANAPETHTIASVSHDQWVKLWK